VSASGRLKQAIEASPLDITTLAKRLKELGVTGGSRAQLHRYLSGKAKTDPPLEVLSKAAEILGVPKMWLAFGEPVPTTWITDTEGWETEVAAEVAEATPFFSHDPTLRALLFDLLREIGSSIGRDRFSRVDRVCWARLVQNVVTYPFGTFEELYGDDAGAKERARREFQVAMLTALARLIPPKADTNWVEPELMPLIEDLDVKGE